MNLYLFRQLLRCTHVTVICPRVVIPRLDYIGNGLELQRVKLVLGAFFQRESRPSGGVLNKKLTGLKILVAFPLSTPLKKNAQ